jgi:hypothetical protein
MYNASDVHRRLEHFSKWNKIFLFSILAGLSVAL